MLLTIGTAASPGGSLQIRIGPVSSFIYVYTGQPIVLVKGAVTTAALTGVVTTASLRGAIATPTVVGSLEQ